MNSFDTTIIEFINQFSQISQIADSAIKFSAGNNLVKGAVLLSLIWWCWFKSNKNQTEVQLRLICTLYSCFIAIVVGRFFALSLPFRLRPLHEDGLDFTLPIGMEPTALEGWSSFPSDHAVLFYALSTGLFLVSKKIGIFSIAYTTIFIGFPRVYLGLHSPTDIIGGAFIGALIVYACNSTFFVKKVARPTLGWADNKPEYFYPVFFIISYQIADMFDNARSILSAIKSLLIHMLTG